MAETDSTSTPSDGGKKAKKGGLITFIKKNKTLSVVVGGVGAYFVYKMSKEKAEGGEGEIEGGRTEGAAIAAYEAGREQGEVRPEPLPEPNEPVPPPEPTTPPEAAEPAPTSEPTQPNEPPPVDENAPAPGAGAISIHGRTFEGATASRIAKTGKTQGGKAYVEYVISFPGRQEHWQFFTATGHWRQVSSSNSGAGANKPETGKPPQANPTGTPTKPKGGGPKIGPAKPVSKPRPKPKPGPKAVRTANRCVNGGIGKHTAPAGYHLFCGSDGWIYRAPNQ